MNKNKLKKIRLELTEEQKLEIKEAFEIYDDELKGTIDKKKFKLAMRGLGFDPRKEEVNLIFRDIVKDNNMKYHHFFSIISQKFLDRDPLEDMKVAFHHISDEGHDKLTFKGIQNIAKELGEEISEEEIKNIIFEADKDKDGEIGEDDFIRIMKKTNFY